MLISLSKKFIFVANTKTGSTSIEKILSPYAEINTLHCGPAIKHMPITEIYHRFKDLLNFNEFIKFGVIRNPVDWFISWYNYRVGNPNILAPLPESMTVEELINSKDWLLNLSQKNLFCDSKGNILVDIIIPYEELEHYILNLLHYLGIPLRTLPRENVSFKKITSISKEIEKKIIDIYKSDYEFYQKCKQDAPQKLNTLIGNLTVDFDYLDQLGELNFPDDEIKRLQDRKWILSFAKKNGIGAEIGVFRGHFAELLIKELTPQKIYLIDPWTKIGEKWEWGNDSAYTAYGKLTTKYAREDTKKRLLPLRKNCEIVLIEDFVENFTFPEKLDWIYLDTSHSYSDTLRQISYLTKYLKTDGIILGDDWHTDPKHRHHGVFRAVNDFIKSNRDWDFVSAGHGAQWCIRKRTRIKIDLLSVQNENPDSLLALEEFHLDPLPQSIEKKPLSLNGVVVLKEGLSQSDFELILIQNNKETLSLKWFIESPWFAEKYPNNPNSKRARFASEEFILNPGDHLVLFLKEKKTESKVELLKLQRED